MNLVYNNNCSGNQQILAFKALIQEALYPEEPRNFSNGSIMIAQRVFCAYEKSDSTQTGLIDLMIFYVECGTQFTADHGSMDDFFYESLETTFEKTLKLIKKTKTQNIFKDRIQMIIEEAPDDYGYKGQLEDLLNDELPDLL